MATVFVKIAVAVDPQGRWSASGWQKDGTLGAEEAMNVAIEGVGDGEARYWVTAVLQVPEVLDVPAKEIITAAE